MLKICSICFQMETKSSEYNKMAHGLKLVPVSAENACGVDYELKTSYQNTMTVDFDSTIKPALMQLKKQCNVSLNEKSRQLLIQQDSLEQLCELVTEQQDAVRVMEKNLNIADEEYKTEKEVGGGRIRVGLSGGGVWVWDQ